MNKRKPQPQSNESNNMSDSTEVKLARLEGKMDNLLFKVDKMEITLEKNYITEDKLALKLAPLELMRRILTWVVVILAAETFALIFYIIRRVIFPD